MSENVLLRFIINKEPKFFKKLKKNKKLSEIRKQLNEKLPNDSIFILSDGCEIDKEDENELELSEILEENKVYIKCKSYAQSTDSFPIDTFSSNKNVPIPGSKFIEKKGDLDIYLYPNIELNETEKERAFSFILLGQTGSGKTLILNSFINYILGIKIEDNFRYEIVHENIDNPQYTITSNVTVYNIKGVNRIPPIQIIDTPGFGNTYGIMADKIIYKKIERFFKESIYSINAICLVAQSSNARLTTRQKFIFSNILDLFGEDVLKNFIFLLTFCDGQTPQIVSILEESKSEINRVIQYSRKPWYYKFNNSAFFSSDREEDFTKLFYKMSIKSFEEFTQRLINMPRISLTQTIKVLEERNKIESNIENFNDKLKKVFDKIDNIKNILKSIAIIKRDLNSSNKVLKSDLDTKIQILKKKRMNLLI